MSAPLILNFDDSAGSYPGAIEVSLQQWQERIRFGCSLKQFSAFCHALEPQLPDEYGTVFMGSGDYHHLSYFLVKRLLAQKRLSEPIELVVFDNHPDNMRFPFGIHCGSWVSHAAALREVSHIHVLGITSGDIGLAHAWENRLKPLLSGKLTYWSMAVNVGWSRLLGLGHAFRHFDSPDTLVESFLDAQNGSERPLYLSIDKDVLSEETVCTNWDQGRFDESHLSSLVTALKPRTCGSDVTGEVSVWRYASWWKRLLSSMDGQDAISAAELTSWQQAQHALNRRLLQLLA